MGKKRKRREYLTRTDHRLDLSPAGRNLFVSRDKQAQDRAARRIKAWMRVVIVLAVITAVAAGGLVAAVYLVPWFREELTVSGGESAALASLPSSLEISSALPVYDEMGLPVYSDSQALLVVNSASPAEAGFSPELTELFGVRVNACMADALRMMCAAAKQDGLALVFIQGYTSYEEQERRFESQVERLMTEKGLSTVMAKTEAKFQEPVPGESDFQTGLCLRLDGDPATFETSKTYSWLKSQMGKYGFVFRCPEYKEDYTGLEADPTVIRYVGGGHAAAMQQRSMCLEEYLDYLGSQ